MDGRMIWEEYNGKDSEGYSGSNLISLGQNQPISSYAFMVGPCVNDIKYFTVQLMHSII